MPSALRPSLPRPTAGDVIAGISVAHVLIPQSLAYAKIAGVPPHVGLFAAALPPLIAAPFTSSPYLQTGPGATTSLLTFGALSGLETVGTGDYVRLAALLALLVGMTRLVLGLVRLGSIAYFMSEPVLKGFTTAAAILIVASQIPSLFGADPDSSGVVERAWSTLVHPDSWSRAAVGLSVLTIAFVLGSRRVHKLFPGVLVVVVAATIWSAVTDYTGATVGKLPGGWLSLSLDLPYAEWHHLVVPALLIAVVGFAEPASISRTFAAADRIPWQANRELVGNGIANLASGISGGYPIGGSFSRSSLNRFAGAQTVWAGAFTGIVVLAALPLVTNLEPLPLPVLGAIVVTAALKLIQPRPLIAMWRQNTPQAATAAATFGATLLFSPHVERGVLVGVALSVGLHLFREMRVDHDFDRAGDVLTIRPTGVVWFASTPALEDAFHAATAAHGDAGRLVVDLTHCGRLDYTGASTLSDLIDGAARAGFEIAIVEVPRMPSGPSRCSSGAGTASPPSPTSRPTTGTSGSRPGAAHPEPGEQSCGIRASVHPLRRPPRTG
ncbi:MAG: SulP family inorganic anion transporter [Acidimicrobiales bacterium]